jgi:hypothetical protein
MSQTILKKNYDNPIKEVDNEENTFTFYGTQKAITHDDSQTDFQRNNLTKYILTIDLKTLLNNFLL